MTIYVAYNDWGDLVATGHCIGDVLAAVAWAGYDEDEVVIGRWTP